MKSMWGDWTKKLEQLTPISNYYLLINYHCIIYERKFLLFRHVGRYTLVNNVVYFLRSQLKEEVA